MCKFKNSVHVFCIMQPASLFIQVHFVYHFVNTIYPRFKKWNKWENIIKDMRVHVTLFKTRIAQSEHNVYPIATVERVAN